MAKYFDRYEIVGIGKKKIIFYIMPRYSGKIAFLKQHLNQIYGKKTEVVMSPEERDEIAQEQGYVICPMRSGYTHCNEDCDNCKDYINFVKSLNGGTYDKENNTI